MCVADGDTFTCPVEPSTVGRSRAERNARSRSSNKSKYRATITCAAGATASETGSAQNASCARRVTASHSFRPGGGTGGACGVVATVWPMSLALTRTPDRMPAGSVPKTQHGPKTHSNPRTPEDEGGGSPAAGSFAFAPSTAPPFASPSESFEDVGARRRWCAVALGSVALTAEDLDSTLKGAGRDVVDLQVAARVRGSAPAGAHVAPLRSVFGEHNGAQPAPLAAVPRAARHYRSHLRTIPTNSRRTRSASSSPSKVGRSTYCQSRRSASGRRCSLPSASSQ